MLRAEGNKFLTCSTPMDDVAGFVGWPTSAAAE